MSESDLSQKFIKDQKELCGRKLSIRKIIDPTSKGIADIRATYRGMPLYAESKFINDISLTNTHPFEPMQLRFLAIEAQAGAMCIGLLLSRKYPPKFIAYDKLKKHITKEEFLNAEEFNWEKLRSVWTQSVLINS